MVMDCLAGNAFDEPAWGTGPGTPMDMAIRRALRPGTTGRNGAGERIKRVRVVSSSCSCSKMSVAYIEIKLPDIL